MMDLYVQDNYRNDILIVRYRFSGWIHSQVNYFFLVPRNYLIIVIN